MVHIEAIRKDGKIIYLSVKGHANYEDEGKDIVCASISAVTVGGINALNQPKCFALKVEKGDVEIKQINEATKHDYDVLETILIQLKSIQESYSKYVKVIEKGN